MIKVFSFFIFLGFAVPAAHAADLNGKILIEPPYPAAKMIKVKKKVQDSCADQQMSKSLVVSPEGGIANTVVWLEGEFKTRLRPEESATLDQLECNFEPHVLLVPSGGKLKILNSDPLAHDVRLFDQKAIMLFRLDMGAQGKLDEEPPQKPGIYTVRCGLHPWMHAFVIYPAHDYYAVSDGNGQFILKGVPEGKQMLHLWHEALGEMQVPVEVKAGRQDFLYTFKNPAGKPE